MTTLREAAQQALEALENNLQVMKDDWEQIDNEWGPFPGGLQAAIDGALTGYEYFKDTISTITALRAALAEPVQKPVAYIAPNGELRKTAEAQDASEWGNKFQPLYTAPPQRKPLTEEEIDNCWYESGGLSLKFARAIERAHGIGERP